MEENKEELSIEEMFDRLDGIMRTLEDSRQHAGRIVCVV